MALPPREEPTSATLRRPVAFSACGTNAASSFICSSAEERKSSGLASSRRALG